MNSKLNLTRRKKSIILVILISTITLFSAIAFCIMMDAVNINIIGMDLEGEGYYIDGMENDRTKHDPKRWGDEDQMYKTCQSLCKQNGVNLERIEL